MIIGLVGRCRSGKSELAKVCEKYGYKKLYFALPLKQLCANILNISVEELNNLKNEGKEIDTILNEELCEKLSQETNIPLENVRKSCLGKKITTVREMLQFIGTDLIRTYNKDWHVNKIRAMINPLFNYVIDDVRFPNEKRMVEELGGDCWFVIRPSLDNVSNHESETSLTFNDCWNRIIINNNTLQCLLFKWSLFVENYEKSMEIREKEFNRILETCDGTNLEEMSIPDMLLISRQLFEYIPIEFDKSKIMEIKMLESGAVQITYKDNSYELIYNPLNIEELKMLL